MYNKEIKFCADNYGYVCFMDKSHPLAHSTGRVYYHRHIMSLFHNRWLAVKEQVHHIDGNKKNNKISNLQLTDATEHAHIHKGIVNERACPVCDIVFKPKANETIYCSNKCARYLDIKNKTITKELLDSLIPIHSWVVLGSMFGYSDVGIKKRAKALGCNIPVRHKYSS